MFKTTDNTAVGAGLVASASRSFRGRLARRLAPLAATLAIVAALAGVLSTDANAAGYNYVLPDGSTADFNLVCGNNFGSYLRFDTYSSSSGVYARYQLQRNGKWGESGWSSLATGARAGGIIDASGYGATVYRLNVQFGKYINGRWTTTSWFRADTFTIMWSGGVIYTGDYCVTSQ